MKKYLYSMLAMATMLFAASCTQEDDFKGNSNGNEVEALFTLELPAGLETRAAGDGTTVDKVKCAVYEDGANKSELSELTQVVDVNGKTAIYNVRLIKGRNYRVVFFAYNEDANAYDITDLKNIKLNPSNSNVEGRDAFTAYVDVTAEESLNVIKKTVVLKRPFAQLNVGSTAEDTEAARMAAGVAAGENVMSKSSIKVTDVYDTFDAFESVAKGTPVTMEYAMNDVLTEKLTVDGVVYTYAAMNYILAGEKTTTTVTFNWQDKEGVQNAEPTVWANVPLQRNFRTNILGSVLTNPAEFNITIDEGFAGDHLITAKVNTVLDLQNAINNAKPGLNVISFNKDIVDATRADAAGPVEIIIPQKEGVDYIIDGCGFKFSGRFSIHGNSRHTGAEKLTFRNINFEATTAGDFISCDWTDNARRYAHNVTVEDCTFTGVDGADVVGMRFRQCYNITVKNVEANNLFLLLWSTGSSNVTVDGAEVNAKYGISFGDTDNVAVRNSNITAKGAYSYAVRVDAKNAYSAAISTSTLEAACPVIVRYATAAYTMALDGNTMERTGNYDVVVTNGNYGEAEHTLETPTGAYTLTGAEDLKAFPTQYSKVSTFKDFEFAVGKNRPVMLVGNVALNLVEDMQFNNEVVVAEGAKVTLNLNGKSVAGTLHKSVANVIKNNGELTIKGGTISSTAENGGSAIMNNGTLVVEDATLNGAPNANGSWPSYTVNNTGTMTVNNVKITSYHGAVSSYGAGAVVTLNNSEIDMAGIPGFTNHGIYTYNGGKVVVNGGKYVNNATDQNSTGGSVINGLVEVNSGTFSGRIENYYGTPVLKGGTYSVKPAAKFVAAGGKVVENSDGTWTIINTTTKIEGVNLTETLTVGTDTELADNVEYAGYTHQDCLYVANSEIKATVGVKIEKDATVVLENTTMDCTTAIKQTGGNLTMFIAGCDFIVPEGGKIFEGITGQIILAAPCKINGVEATAAQISALSDISVMKNY